jgi:hypothetical protein
MRNSSFVAKALCSLNPVGQPLLIVWNIYEKISTDPNMTHQVVRSVGRSQFSERITLIASIFPFCGDFRNATNFQRNKTQRGFRLGRGFPISDNVTPVGSGYF